VRDIRGERVGDVEVRDGEGETGDWVGETEDWVGETEERVGETDTGVRLRVGDTCVRGLEEDMAWTTEVVKEVGSGIFESAGTKQLSMCKFVVPSSPLNKGLP